METPFAQNKNKKIISQGKQTIFRVTSRTQVNLIRIADNKANMIMGINAIIISVLMGIISSRMIHTPETIQGNPRGQWLAAGPTLNGRERPVEWKKKR